MRVPENNDAISIQVLLHLKQLCTECDSETCIFNPNGVCMAPFVTGWDPALTDDGCEDWVGKIGGLTEER